MYGPPGCIRRPCHVRRTGLPVALPGAVISIQAGHCTRARCDRISCPSFSFIHSFLTRITKQLIQRQHVRAFPPLHSTNNQHN